MNSDSGGILGGLNQTVSGLSGVIAGGNNNLVAGQASVIAGGGSNEVTGASSFVGGSGRASVSGGLSAAIGGLDNTIEGDSSSIAGGIRNKVEGDVSFIAAGVENTITGDYGFIGGGALNSVTANFGFAAGYRAKALHDATFVWSSDGDNDFSSTAGGQFLINALNGVGIGLTSNLPASGLGVLGAVSAQTYFTRSSIRFKENIDPYNSPSGLLNSFKPVTYSSVGMDQVEIGVIAEDLQQVLPEVVSLDESGQAAGVAYDRLSIALIAALVEEVQVLRNRIEVLEGERQN